MPLPANLSTGNVKGTLRHNGTLLSGVVVTFTPAAKNLFDTTSTPKELLSLAAVDAPATNASGFFSVDLTSTDDPDNGVVGWTWHVSYKNLPAGATFPEFDLYVPAGTVTDLADAARAGIAATAGAVVVNISGSGGGGGGGGGGGVTVGGTPSEGAAVVYSAAAGGLVYKTLAKSDVGLGNVPNLNQADMIAPATAALAQKADTSALTQGLSGKANTAHTHAQGDVSGLSTALAALQTGVDAAAKLATYVDGTTPPTDAQLGAGSWFVAAVPS